MNAKSRKRLAQLAAQSRPLFFREFLNTCPTCAEHVLHANPELRAFEAQLEVAGLKRAPSFLWPGPGEYRSAERATDGKAYGFTVCFALPEGMEVAK